MHLSVPCRMPTYWEAQEALSVITFLDELRDLLWASYGEEIMENDNTSPRRI